MLLNLREFDGFYVDGYFSQPLFDFRRHRFLIAAAALDSRQFRECGPSCGLTIGGRFFAATPLGSLR